LGAVLARPVDAIIVQYVNASGRRDRPPVRHVARRGYAALAHHLAALHERWSYRSGRVRAILPVSDALRDEIRAAFPHLKVACEVVPNGVESTRFHPDETARRDVRCEFDLGDHDLVAVFVGGDWARKGLAVAIEGITRARDRWTLMVVGDGDVAAYRSLADRHGVADRVVFAGRSAEPEREMAAADVFVLPSAYEGFPLVAIEAAATGLPLVVTAAANCEPLLRAGAGLEVDRSGVGVASALDRLSDVETRALAAGRAREAGLAHEWSHIADRHESVYLSV
jgi:glycosyltransferase involved in cell wall biosynthesis